jgi:hypothetical protein
MKKSRKTLLGVLAIACISLASCSSDEPMQQKNGEESGFNENYISLSEALQNADSEFALVYSSTRSGKRIVDTELFQPKTRSEEDDLYGYYVVNYDKGFAMLSADRRRPAVLALSDEGSMHLSDTISNKSLSWYINDFATSDASLINTRPDTVRTSINKFQEKKITIHDKMITGFLSTFHQRSPYNIYCFTTSGEQAVVGCGPIAAGTVMAYYKWPVSYGGYNFDWTTMYSDSTNLLWSRLFAIIGGNMNADYGVSATGVYPSMIVTAFYSMGYTGAKQVDFNNSLLADQLRQSSPVILGGYGTDSENNYVGHAWVVDAGYIKRIYISSSTDASYTDHYYYRCIWGWNGTANGYFYLNTQSPSLGGTPSEPDAGTSGSAIEFSNLMMTYGYTPNK